MKGCVCGELFSQWEGSSHCSFCWVYSYFPKARLDFRLHSLPWKTKEGTVIPFWLPWFKVGGSPIKTYSHQVSTATLARPVGVWSQGSVHCLCCSSATLHSSVSCIPPPAPLPQLAVLGITATKPNQTGRPILVWVIQRVYAGGLLYTSHISRLTTQHKAQSLSLEQEIY